MSHAKRGEQLAVGALFVALGLAWSAPAAACSCVEAPVAEARAAAVLVFEGVMVRAEPTGEAERQRAVFRVDRVWKGALGAEVTLNVPGPNSMCPPHLTVGQPVILYVGGSARAPRVESCARYATGRELAAERRRLGREPAPRPPRTPPPRNPIRRR